MQYATRSTKKKHTQHESNFFPLSFNISHSLCLFYSWELHLLFNLLASLFHRMLNRVLWMLSQRSFSFASIIFDVIPLCTLYSSICTWGTLVSMHFLFRWSLISHHSTLPNLIILFQQKIYNLNINLVFGTSECDRDIKAGKKPFDSWPPGR